MNRSWNNRAVLGLVIAVGVILLLPIAALAGEPTSAAPADPLAPLARLVGGHWRGEIKMLGGSTLHARNVFEWGLDHKVIRTRSYALVADAEKLVYEGLYLWHPGKNQILFRESSSGGRMNEGSVEPVGDTLRFAWTEYAGSNTVQYRETFRFPDNDHYLSEAYQQTEKGWEKILDTAWARETPTDALPGQRLLRKEVVVDAPLAEVWKAWTTTEGVKSFFGPGARVEAVVGGPYEIYFSLNAPEGLRGSEGCRVHTVVPLKLFGFEWNHPPSIPALRDVHTLVVLQLEEVGPNQVRLQMSQTGWGVGEDWDKAFAHFDRAWDAVLGNLRYRFAVGPVDWPGGTFRVAQLPAKSN